MLKEFIALVFIVVGPIVALVLGQYISEIIYSKNTNVKIREKKIKILTFLCVFLAFFCLSVGICLSL